MDVLDPASMKTAANCIKQYDMQTSENHQIVERQWRPFSHEAGHVQFSVKKSSAVVYCIRVYKQQA